MKRIVRYDPMSVLNDVNKLFEQTFYPFASNGNGDNSRVETSQWVPAVDVKEELSQFKILIDLPGIDKKDITIGMENNVLTVQGERKVETKEEKDNYYRVERVTGKFYRRFTLPETANEDKIAAQMHKGVLEITIQKKEASKPQAIEIMGDE